MLLLKSTTIVHELYQVEWSIVKPNRSVINRIVDENSKNGKNYACWFVVTSIPAGNDDEDDVLLKMRIKMTTLLMEQSSIILANKYSLSRLLTDLSVSSFLLVLKKVSSRETEFWQMYSIEYSTRNQQQNTEWWHIKWTSKVVNYKETI